MKRILFAFFLLFPIGLFAQNKEIVVILKDYETNLPVSDATITVLSTKQGLVSNEEGVFKLSLEKPSKIEISHTTYKTLTINSSSLKLKENIIYLESNNKT